MTRDDIQIVDSAAGLGADVRQMIADTRKGVARAVNAGMTLLYWRIGKRIQSEVLTHERAESAGGMPDGSAVRRSLGDQAPGSVGYTGQAPAGAIELGAEPKAFDGGLSPLPGLCNVSAHSGGLVAGALVTTGYHLPSLRLSRRQRKGSSGMNFFLGRPNVARRFQPSSVDEPSHSERHSRQRNGKLKNELLPCRNQGSGSIPGPPSGR